MKRYFAPSELLIEPDGAIYHLGVKPEQLADKVILVGETLVGAVKTGYLENGGAAEKLQTVPTLQAAQTVLQDWLQSGDAVLFLNDLPDVY